MFPTSSKLFAKLGIWGFGHPNLNISTLTLKIKYFEKLILLSLLSSKMLTFIGSLKEGHTSRSFTKRVRLMKWWQQEKNNNENLLNELIFYIIVGYLGDISGKLEDQSRVNILSQKLKELLADFLVYS